jgi:hypothetical protein
MQSMLGTGKRPIVGECVLAWNLPFSACSARHAAVHTHTSTRTMSMLPHSTQTVGRVMAAFSLLSTLPVAHPHPASRPMAPSDTRALGETTTLAKHQPLTLVCTNDDGKGNCTAGAGVDGTDIVVLGVRDDHRRDHNLGAQHTRASV